MIFISRLRRLSAMLGVFALVAIVGLTPVISLTATEKEPAANMQVQEEVAPTEGDRPDQGPDQRLEVSDHEKHLMARAVHSEARGEVYKGQVAVAAVIINRVKDSRWPDNVEGVIFEPWAFTAVHDGQFWLEPDHSAYRAVSDALKGWDPSEGATFYYNPVTATSSWIFSRTTISRIGKHVFAV